VAFVVATKHHLRAEGGVHHEDLKGWFFHTYAARHVLRLDLLPPRLAGASIRQLRTSSSSDDDTDTPVRFIDPFVASPMPFGSIGEDDEEASLGVERIQSRPLLSPATSSFSHRSQEGQNRASPSKLRSAFNQFRPARAGLKRRPTAVRIMSPSEEQGRGFSFKKDKPPLHDVNKVPNLGERTPLIKPGVKPDIRRTAEDVERSITAVKQVEVGLGKMVELGLPLIMSVCRFTLKGEQLIFSSHEISRSIFRFRRMGCLEAVGPAVGDYSRILFMPNVQGVNAMQALVTSMTDQLGAMERM
jgi:putative membrane protein